MTNKSIFYVFQQLLPTIVATFSDFLASKRKSTRGRKRELDLNLFFKAFFANVRDATSTSHLYYYFQLPKSTYFYYLNLLKQSNLFAILESQIASYYTSTIPLLVDTFTVKSHNGNQGVGRSNTDRGRNGIKVQVISDLNGIIYSASTSPANNHDSKIFRETPLPHFSQTREILMDAAYVGQPVNTYALQNNFIPLVVPKKKTNGQPSHTLDQKQAQTLRQRWRVEQHISIFRRFKSISNKYVRQLSTYLLSLSFAKLLINAYHLEPF